MTTSCSHAQQHLTKFTSLNDWVYELSQQIRESHVPEMLYCPATFGRALWNPLGPEKGDCLSPQCRILPGGVSAMPSSSLSEFFSPLRTHRVWWAGLMRLSLSMAGDSSALRIWGFFLHSSVLGWAHLLGWFSDSLLGARYWLRSGSLQLTEEIAWRLPGTPQAAQDACDSKDGVWLHLARYCCWLLLRRVSSFAMDPPAPNWTYFLAHFWHFPHVWSSRHTVADCSSRNPTQQDPMKRMLMDQWARNQQRQQTPARHCLYYHY